MRFSDSEFESEFEKHGKQTDLETLWLELNDTKINQNDLERQVKYFKKAYEKADLLSAKLLETEDIVKSQNAVIQHMQNDDLKNVSSTPPVLSTDDSFKLELTKKNDQIKRMGSTLASLESALGLMNGERLKALGENHELAQTNQKLQELVTDLQSQAENDKSEWAAIRMDLEQDNDNIWDLWN